LRENAFLKDFLFQGIYVPVKNNVRMMAFLKERADESKGFGGDSVSGVNRFGFGWGYSLAGGDRNLGEFFELV
jgi:hypothetical protein